MEAIKPRQIINYDADIVLIDLHQQRKNSPRQYQSDTEYGATSCQRRTEPAEQPATSIRFLTKLIEQININS